MKKEIVTLENGLKVGVHLCGGENQTTLLFLHGLGSTAASFTELATSLSVKYRILALDLPGHGESTFIKDEKFFSVASVAKWVVEVLKYYNIQDVHLVGYSIGGNIGLAIAKVRSIKSLILLDGGYIRSSNIPGSSLEEEIRMAEQHCKSYVFASWEQFETELSGGGLSRPLVELAKLSMKEENHQIMLTLASDLAGYYVKQHFYEPSDETLTAVNTPVLLLRSTLPEEFNSHREKEAARLGQYLNIAVVAVKEASHDIYWERPGAVSSQISQWIESKSLNVT